MVSMAELRKNLKKLDEKVDVLCKNGPYGKEVGTMLDGAATKTIENVKVGGKSGGVGEVPKSAMSDTFVDGATGKPVQGFKGGKAGSGAGVGGAYLGMNQTGKHFNDGAKDKESMQKAVAKPKEKAKVPVDKKKAKKKK